MRKKCDKVVDCLDAEDELNCKPSVMTNHSIKCLHSGRELEEEILSKEESSFLMERGGQDNEMLRPLLYKKDTRNLLTNEQVSERGFLEEKTVDLTHANNYNKEGELNADSLENLQLMQTVADVVLPYNAQKLSTSDIVRKAENENDYTIPTDEVSDIFMQNDTKFAALTPSYSMSLADKQDNTVSDSKIQGSTLSYGEEKGISVFSSQTQSNAVSNDETQVIMMPLDEIQGTTVSHAESEDNTVSYSETQRNTTDFNKAPSNTISYTETQGSMVYRETLSNTSQSETLSNTIYSETFGSTMPQGETQDNTSSGSITESNLVSDSTRQNGILPEVTKRETNHDKVRRRENRFLVAQMSNIHHVRGMESLFSIMTPKEEITESKSSSAAEAQPPIKTDSSLFSNISSVTNKEDALEIEFSASPSPVNYNINDLSSAKSLVLTGRNEQSLKYIKHGNEDEEGSKISEPKTVIEVAGVFIENITSSMSLRGNSDSESTPAFAEWSESLSTHRSSHSSPESTHFSPRYGANITSSLTFNCKM
jgi:hypothetical protein